MYAVLLAQYRKGQGSLVVSFIVIVFVKSVVVFLGHDGATMLES